MKILIMSDSHNHDANVETVICKEKPLDAVLHLGDAQGSETAIAKMAGCPLHIVAGNCDYFSRLPLVKVVEFGKYRMMLTHGHHYYVSLGVRELVKEAKARRCNVAIYGHTHRPLMDGSDGEVLVLNPGSISFPRQAEKRPTYMVMEFDETGEAQVQLRYV